MIKNFLQNLTKTSLLVLLSLTVFLSSTLTIKASAETTVMIKPRVSFAHKDAVFTVNVTVSNVQNLYGLEVVVFWNASILELVNATHMLGVEAHPNGVLHDSGGKEISPYKNEILQEQGKYILAGSSVAPAPSFNGSGTIVRLTFRVIGEGTCELEIESKLASNIMTHAGVKPIEHITINGFFGPIWITASSNIANVGETVTISGFIGTAEPNVTVTILNKRTEETTWAVLGTVKTGNDGSFSYVWTPEKSGKYQFKGVATLLGSEETSPVISVDINEPEQPLLLYYAAALIAVVVIVVATILMYRRKHARKAEKQKVL